MPGSPRRLEMTTGLLVALLAAPALHAHWVPGSQTTDPAADRLTSRTITPYFTPDDPVTVVGNTVRVVVPAAVLGGLDAASWWAVAWTPSPSETTYDFTPAGSWSAGTPSSVTDPTDGGLQPHQDLLAAAIDDDPGELELAATLRGLPFQGGDRVQWSLDGPSTLSAAVNVYYSAPGARYYTFAGPWDFWGGTWRWSSGSYHDILAARLDGVPGPTLTFRLEQAAAIPTTPGPYEGQPYFSWKIDSDSDCGTGFSCVDSVVWLVYDETSSQWVARALRWNGTNMVLDPSAVVGHSINGGVVEVTVTGSDLGLTDELWWYGETGIVIGPATGDWGLPLWGGGFDWTRWVDPHQVFADGFESGDTSAWSATQPAVPDVGLAPKARARRLAPGLTPNPAIPNL